MNQSKAFGVFIDTANMSISKVTGWLCNGLGIIGALFFVTLVLSLFARAFQDAPDYKDEKLYVEGSIPWLFSSELKSIAPDQLIFMIDRESRTPAFKGDMENPDRRDLKAFLNKNMDWDGPEHLKKAITLAYVSADVSVDKNVCAINLNPQNMRKIALAKKVSADFSLAHTLIHEAIHCGMAVSLEPKEEGFYKAFETAHSQIAPGVDSYAAKRKAYTVFAESFVGAYFLASKNNPGKSELIDVVSARAWNSELKDSIWRGYSNTFAAIITRCKDISKCPADTEKLTSALISDPDIMRAVVLDAMAIIKKSPNLARAK